MSLEQSICNVLQIVVVTQNVCPQAILTWEPQVDLLGLGPSPLCRSSYNPRSTLNLHTFIKEPSVLFQSFCSSLYREFAAAGLAKKTPVQKEAGDLQFYQAKVIDLRGLKSGILNTKPTVKHLRVDIAPRFDAGDLCEKFGDVVWAKDVHLDRVCISETIPEDILEDGQIIGKRHRDIVSIPLPGVTWEPRSFEYLRIPHRGATSES